MLVPAMNGASSLAGRIRPRDRLGSGTTTINLKEK